MGRLAITPLDGWVAGKIGSEKGRLTREQIARYQLEMLHVTIQHVWQYSPFYRRHLARDGMKALSCLEDFSGYPLTCSSDIQQHAAQMVCVSQRDIHRVVTLTTSGTTGQPKRLYFTQSDQELTIDFFRCGMSTLAGSGDKALILLPGERPHSVGDLLRQALERIAVSPIPYGLVDEVPKAVETMCQEQATCLVGVPVQVLAMAHQWESWGRSSWKPKNILLSTDHVPLVIVQELQRIWNCEVYGHYGMTEMGLGGGIECAAHAGYHVREADIYFEIIDPVSLRSLPDGEYGEVVFTTLTRQGMPLLRYRTGDISRFVPEPCPCGSRLRRLERVTTRKTGKVCVWDSQEITMADLDERLFSLPAVIDFTAQVVYGEVVVLKVVVAILPDVVGFDSHTVLQALRHIYTIRAAEHAGRLVVEVKLVCQWSLTAGKRAIGIVAAKEAQSSALE